MRSNLLRGNLWGFSFRALCTLCASLTLCISLSVILLLGKESWLFFSHVPVSDFLFDTRWEPLLEPQSFGVWPLVSGTFLIVLIAISVALPLGLLVAVCLNELLRPSVARHIKPILELLAGLPTVVYGLFALTFVTPLLQKLWPNIAVFNALSAGLVMAIMIAPMIIVLCDDALRALPSQLRAGAYALGGNVFEVVGCILLPACWGRLLAAALLAVSRACGETMIVALAAGALPQLTLNPLQSVQTMTSYIVQVSLGDTPAGSLEYLSAFAIGALLFIFSFVFNSAGLWLMKVSEPAQEGSI